MRPETETRPRRAARPLPDLEAEREVDLAGYFRTMGVRWWILLAAVVAGAVVGYLVSVGSGTVYRAKASIYLGQPVSITGSGQLQSLGSNPAAVSQIAKSESTIREVADRLDLPRGKLRGGVSTSSVEGAITRLGQNPLVTVTVRGPWRARTAQAANMISAIVVERVSGYVDGKIEALRADQEATRAELATVERRVDQLESSLASGGSLTDAERLALASVLGFAEQRHGELLQQQSDTRELLSLAENVEKSRIIAPAAAVKVNARSSRSALVVGALIGLILGIALVLLWEPLVQRRRHRLA